MKKIVWLLAILAMGFVSGRGQNCDPVPPGLVGWWQAEGNALDAISGSAGTLYPGTTFYPTGMVGQAFSFDGVTGCVMNTNTPPLTNIQNNFTIEFWAYPQKGYTMPPADTNRLALSGQSFAVFPDWGGHDGEAGVGLCVGTNGISVMEHAYNYLPSLLNYTNPLIGWVHIAVVYTNKQPTLYVNGVNVGVGIPSPRTYVYPSKDLGNSYDNSSGAAFYQYGPYQGLLDEVTIYNRALNSDEIAAIYNAGSAGKCAPAILPTISVQPIGQTSVTGGSIGFSVTAYGSAPLAYQWTFGGTNILGATNAMLTLNDVQASESGVYAVTVSNAYGSTNSIPASLVVSSLMAAAFFDDFSGPTLDPIWQASLPDSGSVNGTIHYLGAPVFGFETLGTNSVLRLTNTMSSSQRVGWSSITNFYGTNFYYEARFNTLNQSSTTSVDGFFEIWLLDASNPARYDIISPFGGGYDSNPTFNVESSIDGGGSATPFVYQNNTWYHLVLQSVSGQNIRASVYDDYGNELVGVNLNHDGTAFGSGFKIALSQSLGSPGANYPVDVAVDYVKLSSQTQPIVVPVILSQPGNQTVVINGSINLSVVAGGTAPLSYQWSFDGTNIVGATNATLMLADVQTSQAGAYSVLVTNIAGSISSQPGQLSVIPPPPCDPAPAGLIGWWQAEGNANDFVGGGTGTLYPGTTYAAGVVGQCFSFDGVNGCVMNDDTPSLTNIRNTFTIEFWAYPQKGYNMLPESTDYLGISGQSYAIFPDWGNDNGNAGVGVCVGTNGISVMEHSSDYMPSLLNYTNNIQGWVHIAVVYVNKQPTLYVNGVNVRTGLTSPRTYVYPSKTFGSSYDMGSGFSFSQYGPYKGLLDEVSIYNRALSAGEISAIYASGSAGKCPAPPEITGQPTNETILVGGVANLSVTASGGGSLSFQWSFNGTNLLGATNASLTLTDVQLDQAGAYVVAVSNSNGTTNSATAVLNVGVPPVIGQEPANQAVISYGNASFTVIVSGTGPITYQWQKNGTNLVDGGNISGSTTTNLTIAGVTLSDVGNYEVVVTSPYATTNSSVATLAIAQTALSLGSTNGMSGGTITVPVFVNAVGLENTVVASIGYNPTNLVLQNVQLAPGMMGAYLIEVDSQTNNGYVGFAIQLNTGVTLPVGIQEIALLNFVALPVTNNTIINLTFGNIPKAGQVLDNDLNLLPVTYAGGTVSLIPAEYEADVYPRFSGDHQVSAQDWGELGRMVAGLDIPTNSDELLRADCAPRNAPDGVLTVADWVQAGRYALGLDPLTLVPQAQPAIASKVQPRDQSGSVRTLQIATVPDARGQVVSVPVQLVCVTNENAAGMTIQYDVNKLKLLNVSLGSAMSGAKLDINTNKAVGEIGLALALSPGVALPAGTNQVAVIQFLSNTNASGPVTVGLDSSVVTLQVVDRFATPLPTSYANGSVALPPRPTVGAKATASNLQLSWEASDGSFQVQTASSPTGPWTTVVLPLATNGASVNVMVTTTNKQQYYRLVGQ